MVSRERNAKLLENMVYNGAPLRAKLAAYCAFNGVEIKEEMTPGEIVRNRLFAGMLQEAKELLSPEDAAWLANYPILISDNVTATRHIAKGLELREVQANAAAAAKSTTGEISLTLYRQVIMQTATREKQTREQTANWIYRLLLHEIGHARDDRTDAEMAKVSGY